MVFVIELCTLKEHEALALHIGQMKTEKGKQPEGEMCVGGLKM